MKKTNKILAVILSIVFIAVVFVSCDSTGSDATTPVANTSAAIPGGVTSSDTSDDTVPEIREIFTYVTETFNGVDYIYINGVTEYGKTLKSIDVPAKCGESDIVGFDVGAFDGCSVLETLTVHSNITEWNSKLFTGCDKLTKIYMDYSDFVAAVKIDADLAEDFMAATAFDGSVYGVNSIVEGANTNIRFIFDSQEVYSFFDTDYTWGVYSELFIVK